MQPAYVDAIRLIAVPQKLTPRYLDPKHTRMSAKRKCAFLRHVMSKKAVPSLDTYVSSAVTCESLLDTRRCQKHNANKWSETTFLRIMTKKIECTRLDIMVLEQMLGRSL